MKRLIAGVLCLSFLALGTQPASTQGNQPTGKPFRVAILVGISGPTAGLQQAVATGAKVAAKALNAEGGILGRPVEVTVFDHQFDPARAVRMLQQDVLTQNFDMIFPGGGSLTSGPMLAALTKVKIISFAPYQAGTNNVAQLTADNPYFSTSCRPSRIPPQRSPTTSKSTRVKKLGVLYQGDAYGRGDV